MRNTLCRRPFSICLKILAFLLSLLMVFYAVPTTVFAEFGEATDIALPNDEEESTVDALTTGESMDVVFYGYTYNDSGAETLSEFNVGGVGGATMWWLTAVDGPLPIGDILYVGGCIVTGVLVVAGTINALNETTPFENSLTESGEGSSVKAKSGSSKGKGKNRSGNGKKSSKKSGKERASNKPSWANPDMIDPQKTAQQNAQRMLDDKYGHGSWPKGASTEYSKIVKWIQRGGYLGGTIYWICGKDSLVFSWEE